MEDLDTKLLKLKMDRANDNGSYHHIGQIQIKGSVYDFEVSVDQNIYNGGGLVEYSSLFGPGYAGHDNSNPIRSLDQFILKGNAEKQEVLQNIFDFFNKCYDIQEKKYCGDQT